MFGLGKKAPKNDKLTVQVQVVSSSTAFAMAQKLWAENARTVRFDQQAGKEFLHFGYVNPKCVIWLQRDHGRANSFELIVRWEEAATHEVCIIGNDSSPSGNDARVKALLHSMLTTPSVVLSNEN
jgi:hypothetical protein